MKRLLKTLTILATVASGAALFQNAAKAQPAPGQSGFFCDMCPTLTPTIPSRFTKAVREIANPGLFGLLRNLLLQGTLRLLVAAKSALV